MIRFWIAATLCVCCDRAPATAGSTGEDAASTTRVVRDGLKCCVRIETPSDRSSGVVISGAGHILSVAHGIATTATEVMVVTSAGRKLSATVLHRDPVTDVALLRLADAISAAATDLQPVNLAPLDSPESVKLQGRVAFAVGYPAREDDRQGPVCRIGTVVAATEQSLRSDCVLTAGDSGGPLMDVRGRLLGLHQKIGLGRTSNLHIPLAICWNTLRPILQQEGMTTTGNQKPEDVRLTANHLSASGTVLRQLRLHAVQVMDTATGTKLCCGTRISETLVVTKLSELPPGQSLQLELAGAYRVAAKRIGTNRAYDLAFLECPAERTHAAFPDVFEQTAGPGDTVHVGDLVFAGSDQRGGIIARVGHTEPRSRPSLGCAMDEIGGRVLLQRISPNSAAADARLRVQDELISLDDSRIRSLDDVAAGLSRLQPGDRVEMHVQRTGSHIAAFAQLRQPPGRMLDRSEYLDGRSGSLSSRRTGFSDVCQHDCPIDAERMGGPLIGSDGRLVGVNIARRARESVLAIPLAALRELAESVQRQQD